MLIIRRKNADPNKGAAFRWHLVACLPKIGKKFSVSYPNEKSKNHMVPTSSHGAAFGDKQ